MAINKRLIGAGATDTGGGGAVTPSAPPQPMITQ